MKKENHLFVEKRCYAGNMIFDVLLANANPIYYRTHDIYLYADHIQIKIRLHLLVSFFPSIFISIQNFLPTAFLKYIYHMGTSADYYQNNMTIPLSSVSKIILPKFEDGNIILEHPGPPHGYTSLLLRKPEEFLSALTSLLPPLTNTLELNGRVSLTRTG